MKFYRPEIMRRTGNAVSRYKSIHKSNEFKLQQRKNSIEEDINPQSNYKFRIVMKVNNIHYIVWHGEELDTILDVEWKYIEQELVKYMPTTAENRGKWLLQHFNNIAASYYSGKDDDNSDGSYNSDEDKKISSFNTSFTSSFRKHSSGAKSQTRKSVIKDPPLSIISNSNVYNPPIPSSSLLHGNNQNTSLYSSPSIETKIIKLVGACFSANGFYYLYEQSKEEEKFILFVLLNLFIMIVIVVRQDFSLFGSLFLKKDAKDTLITDIDKEKSDKEKSSSFSGQSSINVLRTKVPLTPNTASTQSLTSNKKEATYASPPPNIDKQIAGSSMQRVGLTEPAPHSWSTTDSTAFQVRVGPDYNKNKHKDNSTTALFELLSVDIFACKSKISQIVDYISVPNPNIGQGCTEGVPHLLVINIMTPWYEPSMFGGDLDGPGHSLVMYGQMTQSTYKQLCGKEPRSPAVELLRKFCNDETGKDRLKMIPSLVNGEDVDSLPSVVKKMVASFNSKPILMSKPCHSYSRSDTIYEMDIDAHNWNFVATKAFANMHECIKDLIIDIGFVLQANDEDELPETILLCSRLNMVDHRNVVDILN